MPYNLRNIIFILFAVFISALPGCSNASKSAMKKIVDNQLLLKPADSIVQKQSKGIDFIASGNLPVPWSLEIDFDKMVNFSAADGNSMQVLPLFGTKVMHAEYERYITPTGRGPLEIMIYNKDCHLKAKPGEFIRMTEINFDNKMYSGCGKYLYINRLNDIWELEMISNEKQYSAKFQKGLPWINLDLLANKMNGSDGCNKVSSQIEIKGNRIRFSGFLYTKMACNNTKVEKIFTQYLSDKLVDYYLDNDKLVFYLEDDSKITFKRKAL